MTLFSRSGVVTYSTDHTLIGKMYLTTSFAWVPAGAIAMRAVIAALREWQRKTELSCDRAGLLACQDPQAALRTHLAHRRPGQGVRGGRGHP